MKRLSLTLGTLTVLVLGAVALTGSSGSTIAAVDLEDPEPETSLEQVAPRTTDPGAPAPGCDVTDPLAAPGQDQQACCIDQCQRDRDCRFICGKEFGGQCVMVNSCCRECACLGFAPGPGIAS